MRYKTKERNYRLCSGSTLISSLIAVAILLIAFIGTSSLRYYASLDGRKAAAQTTAARIAQVIGESWRGWQGDVTYNPLTHLGTVMSVTTSQGPAKPNGFTQLGSYKVILDQAEVDTSGADYFATLSWMDIQPGLRALNVTVAWAQKGNKGLENTDKTFTLTTYALTS
jgi:hypothetical protein